MKEKRSEKHGVAEKSAKKSEKTKTSNTKVQKSTKAHKEKKPTDKLADKSGLTIFLQHVFGDAQKKTLRRMGKRVVNINKLADKYAKMEFVANSIAMVVIDGFWRGYPVVEC